MQNKFKKLLLLLSLSLVFVILFSFVFFFLYKEINNNKKISEQSFIEWKTEISKREDIKSLQRSIKVIEEDKKLLETHFIRSSDVVPFLDMVEGLGAKVGIKANINSIYVLKENEGLSIEIKVAGNFQSIYKFLTLLENSPYEIEINSFDFQRFSNQDILDENEKNSKWEGNFKVNLLSFILGLNIINYNFE